MRRWSVDARRWWPFIAIGLATTGNSQPEAVRDADAPAYVLVVAAALTLSAGRSPVLCVTLNGVVVTTYLMIGYPFGPILLTVPAAILLLARHRPAGQAALTAGVQFAVLLAVSWAKRMREQPVDTVASAMLWQTLVWGAVLAAAFAVGVAIRVHRGAPVGSRTAHARRIAADDRLRMAENLHDSLGHGLAVITMQAGVALHVFDRDAREARTAMEAVRATSRESLMNLRAALETLRGPDAAPAAHVVPPPERPAAGLADLDRLTDRLRAGAVDVRVHIDPRLPALSPEVDAAAYRIVHESLTNVLRHAGATTARVRIDVDDGRLLLEVVDTGRTAGGPPVGAGTGSGLRAMSARAEAVGGDLRAGPRAGGGFAVVAWLPLREGSAGDPGRRGR
ncbi:sensor histidine kinase [Actinosynnema sp. CS-041913]|uniref:sensor histidine kinase n=1 Tax=Actinosynnema sp. CS-041913 TaxID=3239917 RepID=UPI003D8E3BE3